MIKAKVNSVFPSHLDGCTNTNESLFIADYTEQTKSAIGTKLFAATPPGDIKYFSLANSNSLPIVGIAFTQRSFVRSGKSLSQCECVVFPNCSTNNSWILFAELKYCFARNNETNLNKAKRQLFKTQYYYKSKGIFSKTNTCYLIASLPLQAEPFPNFSLSQAYLASMKRKHNVIIRFRNSAKIVNNEHISVQP